MLGYRLAKPGSDYSCYSEYNFCVYLYYRGYYSLTTWYSCMLTFRCCVLERIQDWKM